MKTTLSLPTAAADALVELLPTSTVLTPREAAVNTAPRAELARGVMGGFIGASSADVAIVLLDGILPDASAGTELVSPADVLRPAIEAATAVLGAGVLSDVRVGDASSLFDDSASEIYELLSGQSVQGWFAIRIHDNRAATSLLTDGAPMAGKLGRINNVEMALTVEIGRTRMAVRDVLNLEPGGVIELDRSAGAPADVLLNGRLIAHGEVVVVDQDYAVRITKILDVVEGSH